MDVRKIGKSFLHYSFRYYMCKERRNEVRYLHFPLGMQMKDPEEVRNTNASMGDVRTRQIENSRQLFIFRKKLKAIYLRVNNHCDSV